MKKWARRLFKIALVLLALLAVIIVALFNMGGNNDNLKLALTQYVQSSTGYVAEIETLNHMGFYPSIGADFEGLHLKRNIKGTPSVSVERLSVAIGFWDVLFNRRRVTAFDIRNVIFDADTLAKAEIQIRRLGIEEDPSGRSYLAIDGKIGDEVLQATLDLQTAGNHYFIGHESVLEAQIGSLRLNGTLHPRKLGGLHMRDFVLSNQGQEVLSGSISFVREDTKEERGFAIKGGVSSAQTGADATLDLMFHTVITGVIDAEYFTDEDFTPTARLIGVIREWRRIFGATAPLVFTFDTDLRAERYGTQTDYNGPFKKDIRIEK